MLSFPSSFSKGGASMVQYGKATGKMANVPSPNAAPYEHVPSRNLRLTQAIKNHILQTDSSFSNFEGYLNTKYVTKSFNVKNPSPYYEDPLKWDQRVLRSGNMYQFVYSNAIHNIMDAYGSTSAINKVSKKSEGSDNQNSSDQNGQTGQGDNKPQQSSESPTYDNIYVTATTTAASPALFNPAMGVNAIGIMEEVPLINTVRSNKRKYTVYEPTIENLIKGSMSETGVLGNARYRLVDFIYCKDLGKVSNNHLITLRKFSSPIGDHIYKWSSRRGHGSVTMQTTHDLGRLIAWFGTDDNKLEDICKYEVKMGWKEIKSEIQEINSKEDSDSRGPLGMMVNSFNPAYNNFQAGAFGGPGNNLLSSLASKSRWFQKLTGGEKGNDNMEMLRMSSDAHKVWEPKNTVRDTHLYTGELTLSQDITLTFSYKMRAYDNINPKSAFLDLIGNILEVTYQRGYYWAGEARIIGPPQNKQGWQMANNIIDHAWDKMGGFFSAMKSGDWSFSNIMGNLSQWLGEAWTRVKSALGPEFGEFSQELLNGGIDFVKGAAQAGEGMIQKVVGTMTGNENLKQNGENNTQEGGQKVEKGAQDIGKGIGGAGDYINNKTGISQGLKGLLQNSMGRPAMYAMNTLIDGQPCGFWHLTVGNPFNPIMCIGNLRMTNASITHTGPLGVDDFPTEIKVVCSLAPGRSRDSTEISRYYTKGLGAIYMPKNLRYLSDYHNFGGVSEQDIVDLDNIDNRKKNDEMSQEEAEKHRTYGYDGHPIESKIYKNYDNITRIDDESTYMANSMNILNMADGVRNTAGNVNPLLVTRSQDEFA